MRCDFPAFLSEFCLLLFRPSPIMPSKQTLTDDFTGTRLVAAAMKHLFLLILFMFSYGPAYAEWIAAEKRYQTDDFETVYFDPETIHRDGNRATLWQLTDLKWNGTTRFLSFKTHKEFDCERSRVRVLQVIEFSRQMGTGRSTSGYIESGNWQPIKERSGNHALWKAACGKH